MFRDRFSINQKPFVYRLHSFVLRQWNFYALVNVELDASLFLHFYLILHEARSTNNACSRVTGERKQRKRLLSICSCIASSMFTTSLNARWTLNAMSTRFEQRAVIEFLTAGNVTTREIHRIFISSLSSTLNGVFVWSATMKSRQLRVLLSKADRQNPSLTEWKSLRLYGEIGTLVRSQ